MQRQRARRAEDADPEVVDNLYRLAVDVFDGVDRG
jgi:hypothetical protein